MWFLGGRFLHLFHCLFKAPVRFCALWSTKASSQWLLPQSSICPQNFHGWMFVQRRQLLVKNCTVRRKNVLKVLLPLDLIPVIYPAVQNTFLYLTITGSLGKVQHFTVPCGWSFQPAVLCGGAAVAMHRWLSTVTALCRLGLGPYNFSCCYTSLWMEAFWFVGPACSITL